MHYLPAGCTDEVQPIDAGVGRLLKTYIGDELDMWLAEPANLQEWVVGVPASKRRILLTKWTGAAWSRLSETLDVTALAAKTGCLMTADNSGDRLIRPQGSEDDRSPFVFEDADAMLRFPTDRKTDMQDCNDTDTSGLAVDEDSDVEVDAAKAILDSTSPQSVDNDALEDELVEKDEHESSTRESSCSSDDSDDSEQASDVVEEEEWTAPPITEVGPGWEVQLTIPDPAAVAGSRGLFRFLKDKTIPADRWFLAESRKNPLLLLRQSVE